MLAVSEGPTPRDDAAAVADLFHCYDDSGGGGGAFENGEGLRGKVAGCRIGRKGQLGLKRHVQKLKEEEGGKEAASFRAEKLNMEDEVFKR